MGTKPVGGVGVVVDGADMAARRNETRGTGRA